MNSLAMDIIAVCAVLFLAVLVRLTLTLREIGDALKKIGGLSPSVKVDVSAFQTEEEKKKKREDIPEDTELAGVIAVAKAALDGSL